jgi:nucleoside-diphosphate-sugar epimerase
MSGRSDYAPRVRALVIGGTGFISAATVAELAAQGHEVACFHRGDRMADLPPGVERFLGDRRRITDKKERLRGWRPDVVVDCVAFNEADAITLIDTFRGIAQRLVVLSSLDVYRAFGRFTLAEPGPREPLPLGEDTPLRASRFPRREDATKREDVEWDYDKIPVEQLVLADDALPSTVLRLPMVFGPGDHRRRRVAQYLDRMRAANVIDLDPTFASWRWTRCYVDDVARAIVLAATAPNAPGRMYNVGEESPLSEGDWVRAIGRAAGWNGTVTTNGRRDASADFTQHLVLDTARIRAELGWVPRVGLDEALAASIAWEGRVSSGHP